MQLRADPVLLEHRRLGRPHREPASLGARVPRVARRPGLPGRRQASVRVPAARDPRRGVRPGDEPRRASLCRLALPDAHRLRGRHRPAHRAAAVGARADQVARRRDRARAGARGRLTPAGREDPGRVGAPRQPLGGVQRTAHLRPRRLPRSRRDDPRGARPRRSLHALGLAACDLPRRLPRPADRRPGAPGAGPPQPRGRRRAPAADQGARGSRCRRGQGRSRRRERPERPRPDAHERLPAALPARDHGRAAAGAAGIFRAATVGSQAVVPGMWAGDQPQEYIGLQRAIVLG